MPKIKKYRPANGTEGEFFMEKYCYKCIWKASDLDEDDDLECDILLETLIFNVDDPAYPKEWRYRKGEPCCTYFVKDRSSPHQSIP